MAQVCNICGDSGYDELLYTCSRCKDVYEHSYCLPTFGDYDPEFDWVCDDCTIIAVNSPVNFDALPISEGKEFETGSLECKTRSTDNSPVNNEALSISEDKKVETESFKGKTGSTDNAPVEVEALPVSEDKQVETESLKGKASSTDGLCPSKERIEAEDNLFMADSQPNSIAKSPREQSDINVSAHSSPPINMEGKQNVTEGLEHQGSMDFLQPYSMKYNVEQLQSKRIESEDKNIQEPLQSDMDISSTGELSDMDISSTGELSDMDISSTSEQPVVNVTANFSAPTNSEDKQNETESLRRKRSFSDILEADSMQINEEQSFPKGKVEAEYQRPQVGSHPDNIIKSASEQLGVNVELPDSLTRAPMLKKARLNEAEDRKLQVGSPQNNPIKSSIEQPHVNVGANVGSHPSFVPESNHTTHSKRQSQIQDSRDQDQYQNSLSLKKFPEEKKSANSNGLCNVESNGSIESFEAASEKRAIGKAEESKRQRDIQKSEDRDHFEKSFSQKKLPEQKKPANVNGLCTGLTNGHIELVDTASDKRATQKEEESKRQSEIQHSKDQDQFQNSFSQEKLSEQKKSSNANGLCTVKSNGPIELFQGSSDKKATPKADESKNPVGTNAEARGIDGPQGGKGVSKDVRFCSKCQMAGHESWYCWKEFTCNFCKEKGHIEKICEKKNQPNPQQKDSSRKEEHSMPVPERPLRSEKNGDKDTKEGAPSSIKENPSPRDRVIDKYCLPVPNGSPAYMPSRSHEIPIQRALSPQRIVPNNAPRINIRPQMQSIWRGTFKITCRGKRPQFFRAIRAHPSVTASPRVCEATRKFKEELCLEKLDRAQVWPPKFARSGATENDIGLYFFPAPDERYQAAYLQLLEEANRYDLALRMFFDGAQLLIFSSLLLPKQYQTALYDRLYFWGVFRGGDRKTSTEAPDLSKSSDHIKVREKCVT